jgi:hypothetical protein
MHMLTSTVNEYTIENDYDYPARIFFSQGQEVSVKPQEPEEAPPEDGGGEEEEEEGGDN